MNRQIDGAPYDCEQEAVQYFKAGLYSEPTRRVKDAIDRFSLWKTACCHDRCGDNPCAVITCFEQRASEIVNVRQVPGRFPKEK